MTGEGPTIVDQVRADRLDVELAALLWLLAVERVPVHVVPASGASLGIAVRDLAVDPALVTDGPGIAIEEVLRQPVPLRPATGAVVVADSEGRVVAAHLLRPPLRDGAGHVRPQAPGVLAAWVASDARLEHFAWGVMPELAADTGRKAGDLQAELDERAAFLRVLVTTGAGDRDAIRSALATWHRHDGRDD